jgi:hypothetical protein
MSKIFTSGPFSLVREGHSVSCRMFGAEVDRIALADLPMGEIRLPLAAPALVFENDQPIEVTHFRIDLTDAAHADLLSEDEVSEESPAPKRRGRRPSTTA